MVIKKKEINEVFDTLLSLEEKLKIIDNKIDIIGNMIYDNVVKKKVPVRRKKQETNVKVNINE